MTDRSDLSERLRSVLERERPFVSLYLNTETRDEEGERELDLRWRALREAAEQQGAPPDALGALDAVVDGAHQRGDGLVAITSGSSLAFGAPLGAPVADELSVGALPHLTPLLEWRQDNPRVGVVLCDRQGAEIHVLGGLDPARDDTVKGSDFPITKVHAGGAAEARIHRRAENTWEANARAVAEDVNRMRSEEHLELVVVAGDVRAIGFLEEQLDDGLDRVALEIESRPEVGLDEVADELQRAVAAYAGQSAEDLLARFREERGQKDLAADGVAATLAALRMAQVDTLLVTRDISGSAWFSASQPAQASDSRATLEELGLDDALEASLEDVAIGAALQTGATVGVVPAVGEEHGPREGIGALLRFRT